MKPWRHLLAALVAAALLPVVARAASSDRDLKWYADLYPQNPAWIRVQVDTRALEPNTVAKAVRFAVGFYDGTADFLGGRNFNFTSGAEGLETGYVYQRFFPNPFRGAARANGLMLRSALGAGGLSFAGRPYRSRSGAVTFPFEGGQGAADAVIASAGLTQLGSAPPRAAAQVFRLPADGVANENRTIGPYCCTGRTLTVTDATGATVGHVYFYSFGDAWNIDGNTDSATTSVTVLMSASGPAAPPNLPLIQGEARFDAADWTPGTSRTLGLGALTYVVTLDGQIMSVGGRKAFRMSTLGATVEVVGAN